MVLEKSSGSVRERWVKCFLPAAGIIAVYLLLISLGQSRELRDLGNDLAAAKKTAVTEDDLKIDVQRKSAVEQQIVELRKQLQEGERAVDQSLGLFAEGVAAGRMMQIDQMCRELSIGLLNQNSTTEFAVSDVRSQSLKTLRMLRQGATVSFRQLDLVGKYGDILKLMHRLPKSISGVIPLGIEMQKESQNYNEATSGQRLWRIYLLM
ncbi:MAG: hypothetical protein MK179_02105 [Pirellulaceae bacterium]|nr:hypothetical protein [Pirellulaceae bacterium]